MSEPHESTAPRRTRPALMLMLGYQYLLLALHVGHHLHLFVHPRTETACVFVIIALLCARSVFGDVLHRWSRSFERKYLLPVLAVPMASGLLSLAALIAWVLWGSRPVADLLCVLQSEMHRAAGLSGLVGDARAGNPFDLRMQCLVIVALESAYHVGVLPALLTRREHILHEYGESMRIGVVGFANCLLLSVLDLLRRHASLEGGSSGAFGEITRAEVQAMCWPWTSARETPEAASQERSTSVAASGGEDKKSRKKQVAARRSKDAAPLSDEGQPPPSSDGEGADNVEWSAWRWYSNDPDRAHLVLIVAQASFVAVLLLAFVNTDHWRSHGVTLVCNFGLLFACIAFRREQIRGREAV